MPTLIKAEVRASTRDKIENPNAAGVSPEAAGYRQEYLELMTPEERKAAATKIESQ